MTRRPPPWLGWLVISLVLLGPLFAVVGWSHLQSDRAAADRHTLCVSGRDLYDAQVRVVSFIADELHATPEQRASAMADLRTVLGPRPSCD